MHVSVVFTDIYFMCFCAIYVDEKLTRADAVVLF